MKFRDRTHAGDQLGQKLKKYKGKNVVVYAIPRGGVVTAEKIAKYLNAPLDLIITRKLTHPANPEYAIAAIAGNGHIIGKEKALRSFDREWLNEEIERQRLEIIRRRKKYLGERNAISLEGKVAILVDDGIATGLTMLVAIMELMHKNPKKIIVATPIVSESTANTIKKKAKLVALTIPSDRDFLGAVGSYYEDFSQVGDDEVIGLMKSALENK